MVDPNDLFQYWLSKREKERRQEEERLKREKKLDLLRNQVKGDEQWEGISKDLGIGSFSTAEKVAESIEPVLNPFATGVANYQGAVNLGSALTGRAAVLTDRWQEAKDLNEQMFEEMFGRKPESWLERRQTDPGLGEVAFISREDDSGLTQALKTGGMLATNIATDPLTFAGGIGLLGKTGKAQQAVKATTKLGKLAEVSKALNLKGPGEIKRLADAGNKGQALQHAVTYALAGTPAGLSYAPQLGTGIWESGQRVAEGDTSAIPSLLMTSLFGGMAAKGVADGYKDVKAATHAHERLDKLKAERARVEKETARLASILGDEGIVELDTGALAWKQKTKEFVDGIEKHTVFGDAADQEARKVQVTTIHDALLNSWQKEKRAGEKRISGYIASALDPGAGETGMTSAGRVAKAAINDFHGQTLQQELSAVYQRLVDFRARKRLIEAHRLDNDALAKTVADDIFSAASTPRLGQDVPLPMVIERRARGIMDNAPDMLAHDAFKVAFDDVIDGLARHFSDGIDESLGSDSMRALIRERVQAQDLFSVSIPEFSKASKRFGRSPLAQFAREALGMQMRHALPDQDENLYRAFDTFIDTVAERAVERNPDAFPTKPDWYASTFDSVRRGGPDVILRLLQSDKPMYQYVAEGAKLTADQAAGLKRAKELYKDHADPMATPKELDYAVFKDTGWFRRGDGRFVMRADPATMPSKMTTVGKAVPDLAAMFPDDLELTKTTIRGIDPVDYGEYVPRQGGMPGRIRVGQSGQSATRQEIFRHELQHWLEDAAGGPTENRGFVGGVEQIARDIRNGSFSEDMIRSARKLGHLSDDMFDASGKLDSGRADEAAKSIYSALAEEVEARDAENMGPIPRLIMEKDSVLWQGDQERAFQNVEAAVASFIRAGKEDANPGEVVSGTLKGSIQGKNGGKIFFRDTPDGPRYTVAFSGGYPDPSEVGQIAKLATKVMNEPGVKLRVAFDGTNAEGKPAKVVREFTDPVDIISNSARGATEWLEDHRAVIWAFEKADPSTILHELSHVFLMQMDRLSDDRVKDFKRLLGKTEKQMLTVKDHEIWARGFEKHIMEGSTDRNADEVYGPFKKWIADVYKDALTNDSWKQLSPEMKRVMDGLVIDGMAAKLAKKIEADRYTEIAPGVVRIGGQSAEDVTRLAEMRGEDATGPGIKRLFQSDASTEIRADVEEILRVPMDGNAAEQTAKESRVTAQGLHDVAAQTSIGEKVARLYASKGAFLSAIVEGKTGYIVRQLEGYLPNQVIDAMSFATRNAATTTLKVKHGTFRTNRWRPEDGWQGTGHGLNKVFDEMDDAARSDFHVVALAEQAKERLATLVEMRANNLLAKREWAEQMEALKIARKANPKDEAIGKRMAELEARKPADLHDNIDVNIQDARRLNAAAENIRRRIGDDAYAENIRLVEDLTDWTNRAALDPLVDAGRLSHADAEKIKSFSRYAPIRYLDALIEKISGKSVADGYDAAIKNIESGGWSLETAQNMDDFLQQIGAGSIAAEQAPLRDIVKRRQQISADPNRKILDVVEEAQLKVAMIDAIVNKDRIFNAIPDMLVRAEIGKKKPGHRLAIPESNAQFAREHVTVAKDQPWHHGPVFVEVDGEMVHLKHNAETAAMIRGRVKGKADDTITVFYQTPVFELDAKGRPIQESGDFGYRVKRDANGNVITKSTPIKMVVDKGVALDVSLLNPKAAQVVTGAVWDTTKKLADAWSGFWGKGLPGEITNFRKSMVTSTPAFALRQASPFRDPLNHWVRTPGAVPYGKFFQGLLDGMLLGKNSDKLVPILKGIGMNSWADSIAESGQAYRMTMDLAPTTSQVGTEFTRYDSRLGPLDEIKGAKGKRSIVFWRTRDAFNRAASIGEGKARIFDKILAPIKIAKAAAFDVFGAGTSVQDVATRLGTGMDIAKQELRNNPDWRSNPDAAMKAQVEAGPRIASQYAESNLDFSNMGAVSAAMNATEMFANAKLVDLASQIKAYRRNPKSWVSKVAVGVVVPGIIEGLMAANDPEDDQRGAISKLLWMKYGDIYLPRPQGIFRPINYAAKELVKQLSKEDPDWYNAMYETFILGGTEAAPFFDYAVQHEEGSPLRYQGSGGKVGYLAGNIGSALVPVAVEPMADLGANKRAFFGGDITPSYEKNRYATAVEYRGADRYNEGFRKFSARWGMDAYQLEYLARTVASNYGQLLVAQVGQVNPSQRSVDNLLWNSPQKPIGMRSKSYHDWMAFSEMVREHNRGFQNARTEEEKLRIVAQNPFLKDMGDNKPALVEFVEEFDNKILGGDDGLKAHLRHLQRQPRTELVEDQIAELEAQITYETIKRIALVEQIYNGRYKGMFRK